MSRTIVRMWTKEGYHKDVAILSERQVHMTNEGMGVCGYHILAGSGNRVVVRPELFPEAVEFEVIVEP